MNYGPWILDADLLVLRIDGVRRAVRDAPAYEYEVDLEECRTPAQALDWVMQVASKTWATDAVIAGLVRALADVINPQAHLCSFGRSSTITRAKVAELAAQALARGPRRHE